MGKQMTKYEKAFILAIAGGILMLITGMSGAATWRQLGEMAEEVTRSGILGDIFRVLVILGALGGLLVIIGGLMFILKSKKVQQKTRVGIGKVLISIGAGFGLIGLLILCIVTFLSDNPVQGLFGAIGLGFVGLVLSIIARAKVS